jgi:hypothetical protein
VKFKRVFQRLKNIGVDDIEETVFSSLEQVEKHKKQLDLKTLEELFTASAQPTVPIFWKNFLPQNKVSLVTLNFILEL